MSLNHINKSSELTDEQFLLIGKIVIEFSNIEFLLKNLLSRLLLTSDFLGRTYTDNLMAAKIQESIENALDIHLNRYHSKIISEEKNKEIKTLNSKIISIRGNRNKFAHFCWTRHDDKSIFGTRMSGKQTKYNKNDKDSILVTNDEMKSLYQTAYNIVEELDRIILSLPYIEEEDFVKKYL